MFHIGIATQHPPLPEPGQLSHLGIDFIEQCLTLNPAERPTAEDLLNHPWLTPMIQHLVSCHFDPQFRLLTGFDSQTQHQQDNNSNNASASSTYDPHDQAYATQFAEMAKAEAVAAGDELPSFGNTPPAESPNEDNEL